jgi:glutathione S-transferase
MLAQSSAILRYVATVGGLHPADPLEAAHVVGLYTVNAVDP